MIAQHLPLARCGTWRSGLRRRRSRLGKNLLDFAQVLNAVPGQANRFARRCNSHDDVVAPSHKPSFVGGKRLLLAPKIAVTNGQRPFRRIVGTPRRKESTHPIASAPSAERSIEV